MAKLAIDEIFVIVSDLHMIKLSYDLASTEKNSTASYKQEIDWFYDQEVITDAIQASIQKSGKFHCDVHNHYVIKTLCPEFYIHPTLESSFTFLSLDEDKEDVVLTPSLGLKQGDYYANMFFKFPSGDTYQLRVLA